ncbi:MAG TPA: hypothetical protein DHW82_01965 [Spirochaetia bacterium]|nr:MAG: hypothetical protein A2Y41_07320 [Spirochaetes bacterium GWB1_36_13]HCL55762.1 hypothetical protein [Spirochaetia bacterium]
MALVKANLKTAIKTIFDTMKTSAETTPKDEDWLAGELADAIDSYIKTATVTVTVPALGLLAPTGPCTGSASGTGTVS